MACSECKAACESCFRETTLNRPATEWVTTRTSFDTHFKCQAMMPINQVELFSRWSYLEHFSRTSTQKAIIATTTTKVIWWSALRKFKLNSIFACVFTSSLYWIPFCAWVFLPWFSSSHPPPPISSPRSPSFFLFFFFGYWPRMVAQSVLRPLSLPWQIRGPKFQAVGGGGGERGRGNGGGRGACIKALHCRYCNRSTVSHFAISLTMSTKVSLTVFTDRKFGRSANWSRGSNRHP